MAIPPRWFTDTEEGHSQWYIERFRTMAADGIDLAGEARLIDAMAPRGARILDAGCGPGRLAGYLHACGHRVVGVDVDPELIAAAEQDYPGPHYFVADLADFDLPAHGESEPFDAAIVAGNVMAFVARGSEPDVLARVRAHLRPDGFAAVGFHVDRYDLAEFDRHAAHAGFELEQRFSTWEVRPWRSGADFAVSILRNPVDA